MAVETLLQRTMRHEGAVTKDGQHVVFKDSLGNNTIGYGTLIDFPGGLTEDEARYLLSNRLTTATTKAQTFYWYKNLDSNQQGVVVEMIFQLGFNGFLGFHDLINALEDGDGSKAADAMIASEWDKETPSRVIELAAIMRGVPVGV